MTVKKLYIMNCFAPCYEKTRGYEQIFGQQGRMVGIRIYRSIFQLRYQLNKYLYVWCMCDIFQSRKQLYNCKCPSVRPSVSQSVTKTPQPLRIKPICHFAYLLISWSDSYQPSCFWPLYLSAIWPAFATSKPFWLVFYSLMPPHWNLCEQRHNWQDKENWKENPQN